MTLPEFYAALGSDYQSMHKQIPSDALIAKFLRLYAQDPSMTQLRESISQENWDGAFRAAHTLKGVALNLGLSCLARSASELTEHLRGGSPLTNPELLAHVEQAHESVIAALPQLN